MVGAGPNGLSAAIHLARAGRRVLVVEAHERVGGGARTAELTVPGFRHDVCSAIHPWGAASPFFASLPLDEHGLEWIHPEVPAAHPLDGGRAAVLRRSLDDTAQGLADDAGAWRRTFAPLAEAWDDLTSQLLAPIRIPRRPWRLARFGLWSLPSATNFARHRFGAEEARALFAGMAAHSILPLDRPLTSAFGLLFSLTGHTVGWPLPRGGSQAIADALASYLRSLGGDIVTGQRVRHLRELPPARAVVLDLAPRTIVDLAGDELSRVMRWRLRRFRYGPAVFKVDYALDGPVPWNAEAARRAGTVHVGGTLDEVAAAERAVWEGGHPDRPFLLVAQQSVADPARAPAGKHTLWVYTHVPNGSTVDVTDAVERQLERFAPGFRDLVLGRHTATPADLESYNPNYVGGDIAAGSHGGLQLIARPVLSFDPYRLAERVWICSSSTPPGAGVHGMCGYHAAESVLRHT